MDDTQSSRVSDAGAKRKRRSSILKSQRAARAPLSELEFNVATPPDTTKSRRVSFSRRTGVAEFVTNEATTTWKNFYEEHNKTFESSGNDTELQAPRPSVAHLGRGLFDEQFLEVEAINFDTTHIQDNSTTDVKFEHSALECTNEDRRLLVPQQDFEFSTFTDVQSKLFNDELAVSGLGEITDKINVNFSGMQLVTEDFEEMERDLKPEFVHPGHSTLSHLIGDELDVTHGVLKEDASDMSITDTIHSPKVNISKASISNQSDKSLNKDWVADKENIAVNPYVAPKESANFAVNEESDKVLVFDGKRLTIQSDREPISDYRQMLLPNSEADTGSRNNAIVLNMDDDLPNFVNDPQTALALHGISVSNKTLVGHDTDLSMTQALPGRIETSNKPETVVYEDSNISIIQPIEESTEKRRTIIFEDNTADISVTQAVPTNFIFAKQDFPKEHTERRNTIVFEDADGNISITKALPGKVIVTEKGEVIPVKRKTILYETDLGNISVTQVVPGALILPENRSPEKSKTLVFNEDAGNISITQAVPTNVILQEQTNKKRKTIVFDEEGGNISITQAIPKNLILPEESDIENIEVSNKIITESKGVIKRDHRQVAYEELYVADMSVTQALQAQIVPETRKSVVYDCVNVSVTQPAPSRRTTILYDENNADISMTEVIPNAVISQSCNTSHYDKKESTLAESDPADMSVTRAIPNNMILSQTVSDKSRTIDAPVDISMTEVVPDKIIAEAKRLSEALTLSKGPKEIEQSSVTSSDTTITVSEVDNDLQDIKTNHIDDRQNVTFKTLENKLPNNENEILVPRRISVKPIPDELISFQKDSIVKSTDVVVYQTSTHAKPIKTDFTVSDTTSSAYDTDPKESVSKDSIEKATDTQQPSERSSKTKEECDSNFNYNLLDTPSISKKPTAQKSIMDDLLDMQEEGTEDKSVTVKLSQQSEIKLVRSETGASSDSLFFIRDSTDDKSEDEKSHESDVPKNPANHSLKTLSAPVDTASQDRRARVNKTLQKEFENCIDDLEKKLIQLQRNSPTRSPTRNRHFEKIMSSDLESLNNDYRRKSVKDADNTDDLLDMLSKFTDKEEEEDPLKPIEEDRQTKPAEGEALETENKSGNNTRRLSLAPKRQSIVLSREDLLNNISMAAATLQQRIDSDPESDCDLTPEKAPKKAVRCSPEVIKTLRFEDDESMSETSVKLDALTPLKKTAFGETSYMTEELKRNENKPKVIPSFLNEESMGIKELMDDLVKPNADVLPFETTSVGKEVKRNESTCSTQIQANLITSSQIDLEPEVDWTSPSSVINSGIKKLKGIMKTSLNPSSEPTGSERSFDVGWKDEKQEYEDEYSQEYKLEEDEERRAVDQSIPGRMIVFDPSNPLNNVLIAPINYEEAHRYHPPTPKESSESVSEFRSDSEPQPIPQVTFKEVDSSDRVSASYSVPLIIPTYMPSSQESSPKKLSWPDKESGSVMSVDNSVGTPNKEVKDAEINTIIVMKDNHNLLEMSSSLTLVDDAAKVKKEEPQFGPYCGELDSGTSNDVSRTSSRQPSPVKDVGLTTSRRQSPGSNVYQTSVRHQSPAKDRPRQPRRSPSPIQVLYSPSAESSRKKNRSSHNKKRTYDKHKDCTLSALDVTPKPAAKIVKRASQSGRMSQTKSSPTESLSRKTKSPERSPSPMSPKRQPSPRNTSRKIESSPAESPTKQKRVKRKSSPKVERPGTNVTVQRLIAEFNKIKEVPSDDNIPEGLSTVSTSSGSRNDLGDVVSESSGKESGTWQPDLGTELCKSRLLAPEADINVKREIEMLPFMGTRECQWESSEGNCWSFLLLLGRIRLRIHLADSTLSEVTADTVVTRVSLEPAALSQHSDKRNSIAVVCVRFASESMRQCVSGGCARAGAVPALLRRCAGVARAALRWGRAMYEAWVHLAYTLTADGLLTLKVANVPLRAVWEVSLSLELAAGGAGAVPWPRAAAPRARPALPGAPPLPPLSLARATRHVRDGWDHAPRTLWTIFKYLKNKTRDDDLLLGI